MLRIATATGHWCTGIFSDMVAYKEVINPKTWPLIVRLAEVTGGFDAETIFGALRTSFLDKPGFKGIFLPLFKQAKYWRMLIVVAKACTPQNSVILMSLQSVLVRYPEEKYHLGIINIIKKGGLSSVSILSEVLPLLRKDVVSGKKSWREVVNFCKKLAKHKDVLPYKDGSMPVTVFPFGRTFLGDMIKDRKLIEKQLLRNRNKTKVENLKRYLDAIDNLNEKEFISVVKDMRINHQWIFDN